MFRDFLACRFLYRRTIPAPFVAVIAVPPVAVVPTFSIVALFVPPAIEILSAVGRLIGARVLARFVGGVEIVETVVEILVPGAEALLLLLLPGAVVGKTAEIMVGELQIILRIDSKIGRAHV